MDIYEQMEEIVINGKIKKLIIIGAGGMGRTIYSNALECVGYGEVYEEELAKEAHSIIDSWGTFRLTEEQKEVVEELRNIEENPYFWEDIEG